MHLDFERGLIGYNLPDIWLQAMNEDPRLQQRLERRVDPVPMLTDYVLGSWFADHIAAHMLDALTGGTRFFALSINNMIAERIAMCTANAAAMRDGRALQAFPVRYENQRAVERDYDLRLPTVRELPRVVTLLNDKHVQGGVDLGEVVFAHICDDLWSHCRQGHNRFQCHVDALALAAIGDYGTFMRHCDVA